MTPEEKAAIRKGIIEAIKEAGRLAISLFIGVFLDLLIDYFTNMKSNSQLILGLAFIFRLADKYWHIYNKTTKPGRADEPMGIIPW